MPLHIERTVTAVADFVAERRAGVAAAPSKAREAAIVAHLVEHLVEHHHAYARRLPLVVPLLAKVAGRFAKQNSRLDALCDVGNELADVLEACLEKEERELLPALAGGSREAVRRELKEMLRRHGEVERLLERLRWLSDGYVAPDWGDRSYRVLMEELEALEDDVLEQIHLESFVLVPCLLSRYPEAS